jgi:uncharacterized protein
MTENHALLPSFTRKVRGAERGWNTCSPAPASHVCAPDDYRRSRLELVLEPGEIIAFLTREWAKELGRRFFNDLWDFAANRITVGIVDKWHQDSGSWLRFHRNEKRRFANAWVQRRLAWHLQIKESERNPLGRSKQRPLDHPGLSNLGL